MVTSLKHFFFDYDSVSLDYEGDANYLSIAEIQEVLTWLQETFERTKTFSYTIAVRSKYDILHIEEKAGGYVSKLLELYKQQSNFQVILVAGNKKYVSQAYLKMPLRERFETWIEILNSLDSTKDIYLGADKVLSLTQKLMHKYENTKAVLLKNAQVEEQLNTFAEILRSRVGVYSLLITSSEEAIEKDFIQGYLKRRGIQEREFKEKVLDYSLEIDFITNQQNQKRFNFLFLFPVGS